LIGVEITFLEDGREKGLGETGNPRFRIDSVVCL
jgi:hypothetical protein